MCLLIQLKLQVDLSKSKFIHSKVTCDKLTAWKTEIIKISYFNIFFKAESCSKVSPLFKIQVIISKDFFFSDKWWNMQATNTHHFNWPSLILQEGISWPTKMLKVLMFCSHSLSEEHSKRCYRMGKLFLPPHYKGLSVQCSNPQIFKTSNLLSANLSTWYLSSPGFPKHFICSRVTCPTTIRFWIVHTVPRGGSLGSSAPQEGLLQQMGH